MNLFKKLYSLLQPGVSDDSLKKTAESEPESDKEAQAALDKKELIHKELAALKELDPHIKKIVSSTMPVTLGCTYELPTAVVYKLYHKLADLFSEYTPTKGLEKVTNDEWPVIIEETFQLLLIEIASGYDDKLINAYVKYRYEPAIFAILNPDTHPPAPSFKASREDKLDMANDLKIVPGYLPFFLKTKGKTATINNVALFQQAFWCLGKINHY